jgi:hypothetical protein
VWVGRTADGNAAVFLMDPDGRPRIKMQVAKDGIADLLFLDEKGQVIRKF